MRVSPLWLTALVAVATGARSQPPVPPAPATTSATVKHISLNASSMDIREVLRSLSGQSGARILAAPELAGKVTARLDGVPLEAALSTIASICNARWNGLSLPPDKAAKLAPDEAAMLVAAADLLLASGSTVTSPGKSAVALSDTPPARPNVYVIQPRASAPTFTLHRSGNDPRAAPMGEAERLQRVGLMLREDARMDPSVVRAYDDIRLMEPGQIALLAREYLYNSSPEQRTAVVKALGQSQEQWSHLPGMQ